MTAEDRLAPSTAVTAPMSGAAPVIALKTMSDERALIEVRPVDAAHGVIITVSGALRPSDAAELGHHLHREFDRHPSVVVVDLSAVPSCDRAGVEVLSQFRSLARSAGVALHLVHLGAPAVRRWLAVAGLL